MLRHARGTLAVAEYKTHISRPEHLLRGALSIMPRVNPQPAMALVALCALGPAGARAARAVRARSPRRLRGAGAPRCTRGSDRGRCVSPRPRCCSTSRSSCRTRAGGLNTVFASSA